MPGDHRYRWVVLAVGTVAQAALSAVQQGLPALGPVLRDGLGLPLTAVALAATALTADAPLAMLVPVLLVAATSAAKAYARPAAWGVTRPGYPHLMDGSCASAELEARLRSAGFEAVRLAIAGRPALVARRSDFRWAWLATRLHSFVIAFQVADLDEVTAEALTSAAQQYAIEHKGGLPRGLQSGSVTVAVFLTAVARSEVREWSARKPRHRFSALRWPVLLESEGGSTTSYTGAMTTGRLYRSHLLSLVRDVVRPPGRSTTATPPAR